LISGLLNQVAGRLPRYNGASPFEEIRLAEDKTYKAEYVGSGTFIISKPKRTKAKRRQTNLKNPQRGARK
jgi:hypothetical protein